MKKIVSIILSICFMLALAGCGDTKTENEKLTIIASVFPAYDFAREIVGDLGDVSLLLPPGAESHSFEPTPKDIIAIQNCDLFIYTGGESDSWIEDILSSMENPPAVFRMIDAVEVIHSVHDHEEVSFSSHVEFDEHVWTSPVNAMEIVNALSVTITTLDSENSQAYRKNTSEYLGKLEELHDSFIEVTEKAENKTIIMGDRFPFRYLAHEYNLEYMAAFPGCSADSEPGAKTVSQLIEKIKTDNIPVVFHIEFSNKKTAEALSEATGAEIRLLHSCHNVTDQQLKENVSYIDLMYENLNNLQEALL